MKTKTVIRKEFTFDAAHRLHHLPSDHKCAHLHGHTYRVVVELAGEPDSYLGWVRDFGEVKARVKTVLETLDHAVLVARDDHDLLDAVSRLNTRYQVLDGPQTTAEVIARELLRWLQGEGLPARAVEVYETPTNMARVEVDGEEG